MRLANGRIKTAFWVFGVVSISARTVFAAEDFRLFTEKILGAEDNEVIRYVLLAEGQRFSFLPPAGWSVKADKTKRTITLLPQDLKAGITMKIDQESNDGAPGLNVALLRERIVGRYPGAKFIREFECATDGRTALAFDLVRVVEKNTKAGMRIVFAPYDNGTVEFELTTAAARLADYHIPFSRMLYSFHVSTTDAKR